MISKSLGIYGWSEKIDNIIMASVLTGDPLLMISLPGSGKTAFCFRLAKIIIDNLLKTRKEKISATLINAATARPEDWTGFLIPTKDEESMKLIKSPQSLIDSVFIVIDEISRADSSRNQNNLLSLIEDGVVDGIKTKCEILFSAMNPVVGEGSDDGSTPLIFSLADRFSLLVHLPTYKDLPIDNQREIATLSFRPDVNKNIFNLNEKEYLGKDSYVISDEVSSEVWDFLLKSKSLYLDYCFNKDFSKITSSVSNYVIEVSKAFNNYSEKDNNNVYISNRRVGMMVRSILAYQSILEMQGVGNLERAAYDVVSSTIMNEVMGKSFNLQSVSIVHNIAKKVLKMDGSIIAAVTNEPNKWKRLVIIANKDIPIDDFTRIYKDAIYSFEQDYASLIVGFVLYNKLPSKIAKHEMSVITDLISDMICANINKISIATECLTRSFLDIIAKNDSNLLLLLFYIKKKFILSDEDIVSASDNIYEIYTKSKEVYNKWN